MLLPTVGTIAPRSCRAWPLKACLKAGTPRDRCTGMARIARAGMITGRRSMVPVEIIGTMLLRRQCNSIMALNQVSNYTELRFL